MTRKEPPTPHEVAALWDWLRRRGARLEFPPGGGTPRYYGPPSASLEERARLFKVLTEIWPVLEPLLRPRAAGPKDITALRAESARAWNITRALVQRLRAGKPRLRPGTQLPRMADGAGAEDKA